MQSNPLDVKNMRALETFSSILNSSNELAEILGFLDVIMKHDELLRGLVFIAIYDGISIKELSRKMGMPFSTLRRRLETWTGNGWIERKKGCHIIQKSIRDALLTIAEKLNFIRRLSISS